MTLKSTIFIVINWRAWGGGKIRARLRGLRHRARPGAERCAAYRGGGQASPRAKGGGWRCWTGESASVRKA